MTAREEWPLKLEPVTSVDDIQNGWHRFPNGDRAQCIRVASLGNEVISIVYENGDRSAATPETFLRKSPVRESCERPADFAVGDRIRWSHNSRGGHGFGGFADGTVAKLGAANIQIEILHRPHFQKHWDRVLKWVPPATLTHRVIPTEALGEEMKLNLDGFALDAWKHPVGNGYSTFPNGVWYGRIDGFEATVPCTDADRALRDVAAALARDGARQFRTTLRTNIELLERRLQEGATGDPAKTAKEISAYKSELFKLNAAFPEPAIEAEDSTDASAAPRQRG